MTLEEQARAVCTREDLGALLRALCTDFSTSQAAWENRDLASFLAALAAWSEDMEGFYRNAGEDLTTVTPWRLLADMLMGARVYE